jgi:predicted transcriptional regulator
LTEIAVRRGLDPGELVNRVLSCYLEDDAHFIEAVNVGREEAARGEFIEHEEVGRRLKAILRS